MQPIWEIVGNTAQAGQGALQGALQRQLQTEVASIQGQTTIQVLWDLEKLYDTRNLVQLVREAKHQNYPLVPLALGLQAHTGARVVVNNSTAAAPLLDPSTSILAGCMQAVAWAKVYLKRTVSQIHTGWPAAGPQQHIDDLSQTITGTSQETFGIASQAAPALWEGLKQLRFKNQQ